MPHLAYCVECAGPFVAKRIDTRFCSQRCRFKARDRARPTEVVECKHCAAPFTRSTIGSRRRVYCSTDCHVQHKRRLKLKLIHVRARPKPKPKRPPRVFFGTTCQTCGDQFLSQSGHAVFCSRTCDKRHERDKRRGLTRKGARFYRLAIYERDDWTCRICGNPLGRFLRAPHPLSPTIDHIHPVSKGGDHDWHNLQAAHYLCNCYKRDLLPLEAAA